MEILFIAPYVPNLIRVRSFNLIRSLAELGHRVSVLTLWTNEEERDQLELLQPICHDVRALPMPSWHSLANSALALPGGQPLQSVFSWKAQLVAHLNGRSPYDVVHVEHLRGSRYGLYLKEHTRLPVVWDSVDCISHLFQQAAERSKNWIGRFRSRFELNRTRQYEGWLLDKFDHVVVTSAQDRQALLGLSGSPAAAPISVVGNGVDIDHFSPDPATLREPATLVISGKMSYHANISMALHLMENIMPLVWQRRPDVRVTIVGKDPAREVLALASHPNVTVTGTVPVLPPYLRQATLAVAPLTYGAGIQNKVLEAMACATPVLTTPQAAAALDIVPGREAAVAESPEEFADEMLALLADQSERDRLGRNGRLYVETHHHWPNIAARFETIYAEAIGCHEKVQL